MKNELLAKIYYTIGKQTTNYAIQHSKKGENNIIWTKRRTFLSLNPDNPKDHWLIQHCNHRQILQNEIIFDIDEPIPQETTLQHKTVQDIKDRLTKDHWRFSIWHTGSKGVHIHAYNDTLANRTQHNREVWRQYYLKRYWHGKNLDNQKTHDKSMIALEHTPHWKTGKTKTLLYTTKDQYGEDLLWM